MAASKRLDVPRLVARMQAGDPAALGRALTLAETGGPEGQALLRALEGTLGQARIVGFTGPPGAGKSTLVDALIHEWRAAGLRVAVLAVAMLAALVGR